MTRQSLKLLAVVFCVGLSSCGGRKAAVNEVVATAPLNGSAAIVAESLKPVPDEESWFTESTSFKRYFQRVGRIEFDENALFKGIGTLEVSAQGRLLVADRAGNEAYLFDSEGRLLKQLSPESCHPGLDWRPFSAVFHPDGSILVVSASSAPSYRFNPDGDCLGSAMSAEAHITFAAGSDEGAVYAFRIGREEYSISQYDSTESHIKKVWADTRYKNTIRRYYAGGLVLGSDGRLFLSLPPFPVPIAIDLESGKASELGVPPGYYRPVGPDIPDGTMGIEALMSAMKKFSGGATIPTHLSLLDKDKLLVQYNNNYEDFQTSERGIGLHIISTDGRSITTESILLKGYLSHFAAAREGLLYRVTYPVELPDGSWTNFGLMVYRFVGE